VVFRSLRPQSRDAAGIGLTSHHCLFEVCPWFDLWNLIITSLKMDRGRQHRLSRVNIGNTWIFVGMKPWQPETKPVPTDFNRRAVLTM
jgi:hypothetical protein